jgi:hypothetical protein
MRTCSVRASSPFYGFWRVDIRNRLEGKENDHG